MSMFAVWNEERYMGFSPLFTHATLASSFYELIYSLRVTFTLADLDRHPTDDGLVHARTSRNV